MSRGESAEPLPPGASRRRRAPLRVRVAPVTYVQFAVLVAVVTLLAAGRGPVLALGYGCCAALAAVLTFACHEAGHALTARAFGLRVEAIEVRGLLDGGTVRQVSHRPGIDVAVILAGPAASALLALAGLAVALLTADPFAAGRILAVLNLFVLVSSLTAGARSDGVRGWRALRAHLHQRVLADEERGVDPVLRADLDQDR